MFSSVLAGAAKVLAICLIPRTQKRYCRL